MKTFSLIFQITLAVVAVNCQQQYVPQQYVGAYPGAISQYEQVSQQQSKSEASANAYSSSQGSQYSSNGNIVPGTVSGPVYSPAGAASIPYTVVDPKAQTSYATQSYQQNKGEILIHRPAPIIVKRPPTKVLVNHPPLVVKPAPVVLHKPPPVVLRKVYVKQHPRPVKVEPVYVNVVKPPAEKYYVNEKASQAAVAYPQYQGQAQYQVQPAQQQYALQSNPAQIQLPA